jgi:hypothetical protein
LNFVPPDDEGYVNRKQKPYLLLCGFVALITAGLILYSQTYAFTWDEGFHMLAAQLINRGQRPYLDFCFPQTPLNAYWNAGWMHIFGESWRLVHVLAALLTAGAVMLTADFIFVRFPVPRWRLAGAIAAAMLVGSNGMVVGFGPVGQAYGICLFLIVAAFRLSIVAVERSGPGVSGAAGFFAGAAAASSLLTTAVGPVLLVWILFQNRTGSKWKKFAAFVVGAAVPFLPVLWLFTQGPRQVIFNIVEYQTLFRRVNWEGATQHDLEVMSSWLNSSQALLLGLLAVGGALFIATRGPWSPSRRAEFYLSGWLALALGAELFAAHPTFQRYFLLVVPFLAILAVVGLYELGSRMFHPDRPWWPVVALTVLLAMGIARAIYDDRDAYTWRRMEGIAKKVDEVTPVGATPCADELTYFLTRRAPPDGMEFQYAQKLELPAPRAAALHILSQSEMKRMIAAGSFSTVETCEDADVIESLKLPQLYRKKAEITECTVFWDRVR